jgi:microcystin-dependent protein
MSDRRTVYKDAAAGVGGLGPNQSQLYVDGDKLMGQQYDSTAIEIADLSSTVPVVPVGVIWSYAAAVAPTGWLLCDGTEVGAEYTELDALLNDLYGTGGGGRSLLPDLQGRVPLGKSGGYAIGTTGGEATVTLTDAQIPAHSHPSSLTGTPSTTLSFAYSLYANSNAHSWNGSTYRQFDTFSGTGGWAQAGKIGADEITATTAIGTLGLSNADNTGGDNPFDNLPPYLSLSYIIKHD